MKKRLAPLICLFLLMIFPYKTYAKQMEASLSQQQVFFDGREVSLNIYQIGGYNYFKLRDIAALCKGTDAQFNVKYNLDNGAVTVLEGDSYKVTGEDLKKVPEKNHFADMRDFDVIVREETKHMKSALIGDHNYLRLRDLGVLLDLDILFSKEENAVWIYSNPLENKQLNVSNNRAYPWYMDQLNTGPYNISNCGPTAAAMAIKWSNPKSKVTGGSLRSEIQKGGAWWDTNDIDHILTAYQIPHEKLIFNGPHTLINLIDRGDIALLCLDNSYIKKGSRDEFSPYGRYYDTVGGHFLIVKGYKRTNGKLYFEVYDPNNNGRFYPKNKEPMGKDRYYEANDINQAVKQHWAYVYEIMNSSFN